MSSKLGVAVLGATGLVGQKLIAMLEDHPLFTVQELVASEKNQGLTYDQCVDWREPKELPARIGKITLKNASDIKSAYALSALPTDTAREVEPELCKRGIHVVSNASTFRMEKKVPLLIPELNLNHLELIHQQSNSGKHVTNPNCAAVFITLALAPLKKLGSIEYVHIVTLQAISGAGYPGVASMDILGNLIPNIREEEAKVAEETKRILGGSTEPEKFSVTVQVNRIPVQHGHTASIQVHFKSRVSAKTVQATFAELQEKHPELYAYFPEWNRPQPLRDVDPYDQKVHIGRVEQGDGEHIVRLISQGHNLVRGAAGAALLNLEALHQYLQH